MSSGFNTSGMRFREEPFEQHYEIMEELGDGQYAIVHRVVNRSTGEEFAAKFIRKRRYATSRHGVTRSKIEREIDVLQAIGGHENIIKLFDVYETQSAMILVLEFVPGGELYDVLAAKGHLEEAEVIAFVQQILLALKHLHDNHVVHLDIKPENVVLTEKGKTKIKLVDFGFSRRIPPGTIVIDTVGTAEFVAPEIVNCEPLSPATDMWALGVVTYILLSGESPFLGETRKKTFVNISAINYRFDERYFEHVSSEAKDFIAHLFVRDQRKRATVTDCLTHPWICGPKRVLNDIPQSSETAQMHSLKMHLKWRRAVEMVIAHNKNKNALAGTAKAIEVVRSLNAPFDPEQLTARTMLAAHEMSNLTGLLQLLDLNAANANRMVERAMQVNATAEQAAALDTCEQPARNAHANAINCLAKEGSDNVNNNNTGTESASHIAKVYA